MKNKDVEKKIEFNFTAVPTMLMTALDVNCRNMLFVLCQLSDYYSDKNGVFFRTNADLVQQTKMSENLVRGTLDTLYRKGLVQIWSVGKGKGKHANKFRLNIEKFKEYEKYTFDDLKNSEIQICTVKGYNKKGHSTSYLKDDDKESLQENPKQPLIEIPQVPQSENNIEIIYNIENKENTDNINNKEIEYSNKIIDMFDRGMSYEEVAECLAPTDWDCFQYYKNTLKNNEETKGKYFGMNQLFSNLNLRFNPN